MVGRATQRSRRSPQRAAGGSPVAGGERIKRRASFSARFGCLREEGANLTNRDLVDVLTPDVVKMQGVSPRRASSRAPARPSLYLCVSVLPETEVSCRDEKYLLHIYPACVDAHVFPALDVVPEQCVADLLAHRLSCIHVIHCGVKSVPQARRRNEHFGVAYCVPLIASL